MSIATISPAELAARANALPNVDVIDVSLPIEFREAHVQFARNIPLDQLDAAAVRSRPNAAAGEPIYVICPSGVRGRMACEQLLAAGIASVVHVEGGTRAAELAGLPIVRGKKAVSLERQVRIAAGSLVLVGTTLGYFVHPALIGLAAFVGAGLVFAGITDTCGMGMLLARMPWNKVAAPPAPPTPTACAIPRKAT